MGLLDRFIDTEKTSKMTVTDPREIFNNVLKGTSGAKYTREIKYEIFYQTIAFKGVVDGVGTSTLVANVAQAIGSLGLNVLVIDTSILQPVQDVLLKTTALTLSKDKPNDFYDWFDMPYTKKSPLHESSIQHNISVLSFYGKNRNITDILSTNDNANLVEMALATFHNKFDIILIDCCHELTSVNTACMQMCNRMIQCWNDSPAVVDNIARFINNCLALSCPLDKMRDVVLCRMVDDINGNLNDVLKEYRLRKLAENYTSKEISRIIVNGKQLWQYPLEDSSVIQYTNCVIDIVNYICNIDKVFNKTKGGTISSNDIMGGKVTGTLSKKMRDENENGVEVARTLQQADNMVANWGSSDEQDLFAEFDDGTPKKKSRRG